MTSCWRSSSVWLLGSLMLSINVWAEPVKVTKLIANKDFSHETGTRLNEGITLDRKRDSIGYVLAHLNAPLILSSGTYRFTFLTQRGHSIQKGMLKSATPIFRLELWDHTTHELINQRELHWDDYPSAHIVVPFRLETSLEGRQGHFLEPKVFWYGLVNADIFGIEIDRFIDPSLPDLELKAMRIGEHLRKNHLENGFVVSRTPDGKADEIGDATTYTGYYAASLAWKYQVTKDTQTLSELMATIDTLHSAIKGSQEQPVLVRYVDDQGQPFAKSPSKDVYTSFFFAYAAAAPVIKNTTQLTQMKQDLSRIISEFWNNEWAFIAGRNEFLSLAPYFSSEEVRQGIRSLLSNPKQQKKVLGGIKKARRMTPIGDLWPGAKEFQKAIKKKDEKRLFNMVIPTLNGLMSLLDRVIDYLKEKHRSDLFFRKPPNPHQPGQRLGQLLSKNRAKLYAQTGGSPLRTLSDFKILGGNALIALHMLKTSVVITRNPMLRSLERKTMQQQPSLLDVANNWYEIDEDFLKISAGNPTADRERRGTLTLLALHNLLTLEKSTRLKQQYQALLERWWASNQNEDNPLGHAIVAIGLERKTKEVGLILRALDQYPEQTTGWGNDYWQRHGKEIAEQNGAGEYKGYSREALPVALRPKDSFLWQRNSRRLSGDSLNTYPGTDYLFLYWLCRAHGLF